jgi:hypothetical protein
MLDSYPIYGPYQASGQLAVSCWQKRDYSATSATGCSDGKRSCQLNDQWDYTQGHHSAWPLCLLFFHLLTLICSGLFSSQGPPLSPPVRLSPAQSPLNLATPSRPPAGSISKIISSTPLARLRVDSVSTRTLATPTSPWATITTSPSTRQVPPRSHTSVGPSTMVAGAPVVPLEHPTPARAPQLVALLMGRLLMDAPHQQQLLLRQRLRLLRQQLRQLFDLLRPLHIFQLLPRVPLLLLLHLCLQSQLC